MKSYEGTRKAPLLTQKAREKWGTWQPGSLTNTVFDFRRDLEVAICGGTLEWISRTICYHPAMLVPQGLALFLAALLLVAFIVGTLRLLRYCVTGKRDRLRVSLAAWFLLLSVLLLRITWISFVIQSNDMGQAMAALSLGIFCFIVAAVFGVLALAYFAPTIWTLLKGRRQSSSDAAPASAAVTMRWPEALLVTLIVIPLLGVTCLSIVGNDPALVFRAKSDRPLSWLKATTNPPANIYTQPANDWAATSIYTESPSGKWTRIAFPNDAHYRRLAILSPDSVLITWPSGPPLPLSLSFNNLVGAVYKKGSAEPVATVPGSDNIASIPSGGFTTTSCEPPPRCQDHSCRSCASITVRRFDALGVQIVEAAYPVPPDTERCAWWTVHRLMDDDLVYSLYHCPAGSNGEGYYRASPSGIQRITSRVHSDQYTAVEDQNELESQTQPVTWYHIPWIQDPM